MFITYSCLLWKLATNFWTFSIKRVNHFEDHVRNFLFEKLFVSGNYKKFLL